MQLRNSKSNSKRKPSRKQIITSVVGSAVALHVGSIVWFRFWQTMVLNKKQQKVIVCGYPFATCSKRDIQARLIDNGVIVIEPHLNQRTKK